MGAFQWTGLGCDVCGFGTVEDVDEFDPKKPCPDCGAVMLEIKCNRCKRQIGPDDMVDILVRTPEPSLYRHTNRDECAATPAPGKEP